MRDRPEPDDGPAKRRRKPLEPTRAPRGPGSGGGGAHPPPRVPAAPGAFLEFAPIDRRYDAPLDGGDPANRKALEALEANPAASGEDEARALEYWIDCCSRLSRWQKPAARVPFDGAVFRRDLAAYASRGVRHVTSFGVFIDADYLRMHGEPPVGEYGAAMRGLWRV